MNDSLIDMATFTDLRDAVGDEFIAELVDTFLVEAPNLLAALREAAAAGDTDGYRRAAHSLKSNSNTFGATGLGNMAREHELNGVSASPPLDTLDATYVAVAEQLKELCNG